MKNTRIVRVRIIRVGNPSQNNASCQITLESFHSNASKANVVIWPNLRNDVTVHIF